MSIIKTYCRQLKEAQNDILSKKSIDDIIKIICEWANRWKKDTTLFDRYLKQEKHYPEEILDRGIKDFVSYITKDNLRKYLDSELYSAAILDEHDIDKNGRRLSLITPQLTGQFIAGNVPLLSWQSVLYCLLVKSSVLLKISQSETLWTNVLVETLIEIEPSLADCIKIIDWSSDDSDEWVRELCMETDAMIVYGSDSTIEHIRKSSTRHLNFIPYGHGFSIAIYDLNLNLEDKAENLALDTWMYYQKGCLSPHVAYVYNSDVELAHRFCEIVADKLDMLYSTYKQPKYEIDISAIHELNQRREMSMFYKHDKYWGDDNFKWTVIYSNDINFIESCTYSTIYIKPFNNFSYLKDVLTPYRSYLQTIAADNEIISNKNFSMIKAIGPNRICKPGFMQFPSFFWNNDGKSLLRSLVSFVDIET